MSEYAGRIRIKAEIDAKKIDSDLAALEAQMVKLCQKIKAAQEALKKLEETKVHTAEYAALEKKLSEATKQLEALRKEEAEMEEIGLNFGSPWDNLIEKEAKTAEKIDEIKTKMQEMEDAGTRFIDQTKTAEYQKLDDQIKACEEDMVALVKKADWLATKLTQVGQSTKSGIPDVAIEKDPKTEAVVKDIQEGFQRIKDMASEYVDANRLPAGLSETAQIQEEIADKTKDIIIAAEEQSDKQEEIAENIREAADAEEALEENQEDFREEVEETTRAIREQNEEISEAGNKTASATNKLKNAEKDVQKELKKTGKSASNMHKNYEKGSKKTSKTMRRFSLSIKSMLVNAFMFNWVFMFFSGLSDAIKETFNELATADKETKRNVTNLKDSLNGLAAAFMSALAPALNMIMPAVSNVSDGLSKAFDKAGMFIAALSGEDYYKKLKKGAGDASKAVDGIGSSADNAKGKLAGFDDLDVLDNDGKKSEIEEMEIDPEIATEAMKINEILEEMREIIPTVKEKVLELGESFQSGFEFGLGEKTADTLENIKIKAIEVGGSLVDIFSNTAVSNGADELANSVSETLGSIVGSVGRVGLDIGSLLVGSVASYLDDSKDYLQNRLVSIFNTGTKISDTIKDGLAGIGKVADTLVTPEAERIGGDILGIFADTYAGVADLFSSMFADKISLLATPITDNIDEISDALVDLYGSIGEITSGIHNVFSEVMETVNVAYENAISPAIQGIRDDLSEMIAVLVDGWKQYIQPTIDQFSEKFGPVLEEKVAPAIQSVIKCIAALIASVIHIAGVISPFIIAVLQPILKILGKIGGAVGDTVIWTIEKICDLLLAASEMLKDFFDGVSDAADAIKSKFSWLKDGISISGIFKGGKQEVATTYSLDTASLPHYADGAVIRGGNPYLAIVGDQPHGQTNIETPMSTMLDAFREVLNDWNPRGGGGTVILELDGRELARAEIDYITEEANRRGISLV